MNPIIIELKKCKRSGMILSMLAMSGIGTLYGGLYFILKKDSILSMAESPMQALLSQIYCLSMVVNMFAIIAAACSIYNIEYSGNAMAKMHVLPTRKSSIYASKFIILSALTVFCIAFQNIAVGAIGMVFLDPDKFKGAELLSFAFNALATSLPVMSFMLFVSSRCENIWTCLGIGLSGFFSGMTMAFNTNRLFLINPFVLMMKPAVSQSTNSDFAILSLSILYTFLFLAAGMFKSEDAGC